MDSSEDRVIGLTVRKSPKTSPTRRMLQGTASAVGRSELSSTRPRVAPSRLRQLRAANSQQQRVTPADVSLRGAPARQPGHDRIAIPALAQRPKRITSIRVLHPPANPARPTRVERVSPSSVAHQIATSSTPAAAATPKQPDRRGLKSIACKTPPGPATNCSCQSPRQPIASTSADAIGERGVGGDCPTKLAAPA